MRFLLTSAGIKNASIHDALVDLLGKPIAEASALCIPTSSYALPGGANLAWRFISGHEPETPKCELGWKSLGVLELTALPSIDEELWVPMVRETDVLLVNGGDPLYLSYWMQQSGLADLLPSLPAVYVGLSAGSMVMKRSAWSTFRSFRTWITRICRTTQWPTQNDGPPACRGRRMRSTTRPPSKWSTAPSTSSPRGTGSFLLPDAERPKGFDRDSWLR